MDIDYTNIRDEALPQRDGSLLRVKRVEFYIGKHGPFVERFPPEATALEIELRIRQLHGTLEQLPRTL